MENGSKKKMEAIFFSFPQKTKIPNNDNDDDDDDDDSSKMHFIWNAMENLILPLHALYSVGLQEKRQFIWISMAAYLRE